MKSREALKTPLRKPASVEQLLPVVEKGSTSEKRESLAGAFESLQTLIEDMSLLPKPINGVVIEDIRARIPNDAFAAIILLRAELERGMREILAANGRLALGDRFDPVFQLAKKLTRERGVSIEFEMAVNKFFEVASHFAHGRFPQVTGDKTEEIAYSGLRLLEILQRIPRPTLFIDAVDHPVFFDVDCKKRDPDREGIVLIFAATPGSTGHIAPVATTLRGYYRPGQRVTNEWRTSDSDRELWIMDPDNKKAQKITFLEDFEGRSFDEIL